MRDDMKFKMSDIQVPAFRDFIREGRYCPKPLDLKDVRVGMAVYLPPEIDPDDWVGNNDRTWIDRTACTIVKTTDRDGDSRLCVVKLHAIVEAGSHRLVAMSLDPSDDMSLVRTLFLTPQDALRWAIDRERNDISSQLDQIYVAEKWLDSNNG